MKLSAIFQGAMFKGVVETEIVEKLVKEASISDYTEIQDVVITNVDYDCRGEKNVVYWNGYEKIDDLQGGFGNTVIKK